MKQNNTRGTRNARPGEVRQVLAELGLTVKSFQGKNLRVSPSPCCDHVSVTNSPCFSIDEDTGLWRCFNGACLKKAGNWVRFCDTVRIPLSETERYLESNVAYFKDEWVQLMKLREGDPISPAKHAQLLEYCSSRRITKDTLDEFRVSTHDGRSIMVPIFTAQDNEWVRVAGRVIGCLGERKGTNFYAYSGGPTHLLMGNNLLDLTAKQKRIYLFEGQWDMFTAYELGLRNVFSLPNGASNIKAKEMLQFVPEDWEIYVCTDMDEAGNAAARSIFCQIVAEKYRRIKIPAPHKDLNDWFVAEPQLTKEDVLSVAVGIDIDDRQKDRVKKRLDWMNLEPTILKPIAFTPWKNFNTEIHGGLKPGQSTIFNLVEDFTRSVCVNQIALHNAGLKIKTALLPLSEPQNYFLSRLKYSAKYADVENSILEEKFIVNPIDYKATTPGALLLEIEDLLNEDTKLIIINCIEGLLATNYEKEECFKKICKRIKNSNAHVIFVIPSLDNLWEGLKCAHEMPLPYFFNCHDSVDNEFWLRAPIIDSYNRYLSIKECREGIIDDWFELILAASYHDLVEYSIKQECFGSHHRLDFEGKKMITPKKKTKAI